MLKVHDMRPRLASVIRVRNEIDIVEPLIRHHAAYFDCMLVLDDGSVDGSYERLCALRDKGLPLVLERTVSVGHSQRTNVTRLSRLAVDQYGADWVIPIDADEFVEPPAGLSLKDVLADLPAEVHRVGWSGFLWSRDQDEKADISPVFRLTDRLSARQDHAKVVIPAAIVRHDDFYVGIGNHGVFSRGAFQDAPLFTGYELCHYPIRSRSQYIGKVVVNYLQHRASSAYRLGEGFQYDEAFPIIAEGNMEDIASVMERQSRRYSVDAQVSINETVSHAPLRYVGGPIAHRVSKERWTANILAFAEDLASRFAGQSRREAAIADALADATAHLVDASPSDRVVDLQERHRLSDESLRTARQEVVHLSELNEELRGHCAILGERLLESERALSQVRATAEKQTAELSRRLVRFARWLGRYQSSVLDAHRET